MKLENLRGSNDWEFAGEEISKSNMGGPKTKYINPFRRLLD
jgi:hypothetical protein